MPSPRTSMGRSAARTSSATCSTSPALGSARFSSVGDVLSLTAAEPHNNIMRVTLQALAIVLSGAQAVHTMSWDEALALPSEEAVKLALRTQQIVAYESGVTRTADPLGGSYYVESLTDELEQRVWDLLRKIEDNGGVVSGIEDGSLERTIAEAAYHQEQQIETGERVVVGVNRFRDEQADEQEMELLTVPEHVRDRQLAGLAKVRAARDEQAVQQALAAVTAAAAGAENTMPAILDAVRAYATVGEISSALAVVFGHHRPLTAI